MRPGSDSRRAPSVFASGGFRGAAFGAVLALALGLGCQKKVGGPDHDQRRARAKPLVDAAARAKPPGPVARILLFTAKWCTTCHQLKHDVLERAVGKKLLAGATLELVDFDAPVNRARVSQYAVTGLPTTVFLGRDGKERDRIEGFEGSEAFVAEARAIRQGRDLLPVLEDQALREPGNVTLLYKLGRKLLGRGQQKKGFAHYDRVLQVDPKDQHDLHAKIFMHRGRYLVRVKRDYPAAVKHLRGAVKRITDGRSGEALRYWLGHALCLAGRKAEAAKAVDAYVKQRDSDAKSLLLAAGVRRKCGHDLPRALKQAEHAVKQKPKNDWGWYLVADLSRRLGRAGRARTAINKAIALGPKVAFYRSERRRMLGKGMSN